MTPQTFERLFQIESYIREHNSNIDLLQGNFIDSDPDKILFLRLELKEPLGENSSGESISGLEIWGSGHADPNAHNYGINARIVTAATNAILAELKLINQ